MVAAVVGVGPSECGDRRAIPDGRPYNHSNTHLKTGSSQRVERME